MAARRWRLLSGALARLRPSPAVVALVRLPDAALPSGWAPAPTLLYAGVALVAVFWIYDMVTAPLFANLENKKLRQQFLPRGDQSSWRFDPRPDAGIAQLGPGQIGLPTPVGAGWTFTFN